MARLKRESITERVHDILQRDIEAGAIQPGARIVEEHLARRLGVSKTPLRLALHQLKQNGLVRIEPRRGIYLTAPSVAEVLELIDMREVLEGLAARRAARQPKKAFVQQMRACFKRFDEATLSEHRLEYAAADHRFHRLLIKASGSKELARTLELINLRLHMNRLRTAFTRGHDLRPIHQEHLDIIEALDSGEPRKAELLVRAHIRNIPWQTVLDASAMGTPASQPVRGNAA